MFDCALLGLALGIALLFKRNAADSHAPHRGSNGRIDWLATNPNMDRAKGAIVAGLAGYHLCAMVYLPVANLWQPRCGLDQVEEMQQAWNHPAGTFFGMLNDRRFRLGTVAGNLGRNSGGGKSSLVIGCSG